MRLRETLVLAVHPMTRGFGWIAYAGPFVPFDWRIVETKKAKNAACIAYMAKLLDRLQPATLVLEDFEPGTSRRDARVSRLGKALVALASDRGIEIAVARRTDVQACFSHLGAKTRQEIAEAVARHTPILADRLPRKRRAWDREDLRMSLFSAAALVVTHYALDANRLLDDLRDAV
jgi:hypothetical protein